MGQAGDYYGAVMEMVDIPQAIEWQARHCEEAGASGTARVIRAFAKLIDGETRVGHKIAQWEGLTLKDAVPLRLAAGLHNLMLTGADMRLEKVYSGALQDQRGVDALVGELVVLYDARLLPWLDGPPQTNEAGRSASLMAGLLWLAGHVPARFEMLEIGSSAGINTMMDRYSYDLGGVKVGPSESPMHIVPEWRGPPPPCTGFEIASIRGCDVAPVDLTDPDAARRLQSYVWPEAKGRMERIAAARALAAERAPYIRQMDAAHFVESELHQRQEEGSTRVLYHSIVWQYIPDDQQRRICAAMAQAARRATSKKALAWLELETNRKTFRHELKLRFWPACRGEDANTPIFLGTAHPHGAWVEWLGEASRA